jgi:hypothetical protein
MRAKPCFQGISGADGAENEPVGDDWILDPKRDITLSSLQRGGRVTIELV